MAHWDPRLPVTSSDEPAWMPQAENCYRDALQALLASGLPFVVGGVFAMHRHTGIWRSTKDLDFFLPAHEVPEAFRQLERVGFSTRVDDPVWLAKAQRGEYFVDLITGVGNATLCVDATWMERGLPEVVLGVECKVLAPEECLASKMCVAFRERFDGADVVHLIKACGPSLNWDRVLSLMGMHWEMLYWSLVLFAYVYPARTDLVPNALWEDLTRRFIDCFRKPNRNAPFRGSLVDPRMFSIDVEEWGERNLYKELCERYPCPLPTADPTGNKG